MIARNPQNRWPREQDLAFTTLPLRLKTLTRRWRRSTNWAAKLSAIQASYRSNSVRRAAQSPKSFPKRDTRNRIKNSNELPDQSSLGRQVKQNAGGNHGDHGKDCPVRSRVAVRKDPGEGDRDCEARGAGLPRRRACRQQGRGRQNLC